MTQFENDTEFYRSKLSRDVVVAQLGAKAFSIMTDAAARSDYFGFLESMMLRSGSMPAASQSRTIS